MLQSRSQGQQEPDDGEGVKEDGAGEEAFMKTIETLGKIEPHPNLVALKAYGLSDGKRLVVSDYIPNGNLEQLLFPCYHMDESRLARNAAEIDWGCRLKIAIGVAEGLVHLHNAGITHGNLKLSNILLHHDRQPLLSDYGLNSLFPEPIALGLPPIPRNSDLGDAFYRDPVTILKRLITLKYDVYSFGVVLLQLVTGKEAKKMPFNCAERRLYALPRWVDSLLEKQKDDESQGQPPRYLFVDHLLDPRLRRQSNGIATRQHLSLFTLAMSCFHVILRKRPNMVDVLTKLKEIPELNDPAPIPPGIPMRPLSPESAALPYLRQNYETGGFWTY